MIKNNTPSTLHSFLSSITSPEYISAHPWMTFLQGSYLGQLVIAVILALFAIAVVLLVLNIRRIILEHKAVKVAITNFQETDSDKLTASELVKKIKIDLPESTVKQRIDLLYRVRQIHSLTIDLLDRLDYLEESKNYRFIRFTANTLIILGLIGTVFGLAISVGEILPAIDNAKSIGNVTKLAEAMANTMSGLQTAFNTTLVALACTFLLGLFTSFVQRRESKYVHDLEEFTTFELLPALLISSDMEANSAYIDAINSSAKDIEKAANALQDAQSGIGEVVSGLIDSTKINENRIVDFFNFAQTFKESVGHLMAYKDEIRAVYDEINAVLSGIKNNQITDQVISTLVDKSIARAVEVTNEAADNMRQHFLTDVKNTEKVQQQFLEAINGTKDAVLSFATDNADAVKSSLDTALEDQNKKLEALLKHYEDGLERIAKREDVSRMIAADAADQLRTYVENANRIGFRPSDAPDQTQATP